MPTGKKACQLASGLTSEQLFVAATAFARAASSLPPGNPSLEASLLNQALTLAACAARQVPVEKKKRKKR